MSQLKVNSIIPAAGLTSGKNGGIIQLVQTTKPDIQSITAYTTNPIDIANFSVTIKPSIESNKVLVHFILNIGTNGHLALNLRRGNTDIAQGTLQGTNRKACSVAANTYNAYSFGNISFMYLDSPNTTNDTTYKVNMYLSEWTNAYVAHINRASTNYDDQNYSFNPLSTITAMEVSG